MRGLTKYCGSFLGASASFPQWCGAVSFARGGQTLGVLSADRQGWAWLVGTGAGRLGLGPSAHPPASGDPAFLVASSSGKWGHCLLQGLPYVTWGGEWVHPSPTNPTERETTLGPPCLNLYR